MVGFYIKVSIKVAEALRELAIKERRDPKEQAAVLIERELERRGFIKMDSITITPDPNAPKIGRLNE